jgi:heme exporter protein CcmB
VIGAPRTGIVEGLSDAWVVLRKDLRVEWRSKEVLVTSGFFGLVVVLVFSFSFFRGDAPLSVVAAGILWISLAFSGTLALQRIYAREREADGLRALLLTPASPAAVFLGKTGGVVALMILLEVVLVVAVGFFFSLSLDAARWGMLAVTLLLGTVGYAVLGSLLSAMLLGSRSRDVLLVIILYPLAIPVLILGVKATAALIEPVVVWNELQFWLRVLAGFDLIFATAALWLFEPLIGD